MRSLAMTTKRGSGAQPHRRAASLAPLLAICCQIALLGTANAAAKDKAPAEADASATIPSAYELHVLYQNRTWVWKDGAAYFAKDNRRLRAWTSQDTAWVAEGRWLVTKDGKMCMEAAWRSKDYPGKLGRTCFSHRINGGNIEQRKDPDGQWYNFKHSAEEPSDEYKKFEQGDTKGAQFEDIRKLVDSKS
jgi:hypothetical protein